MRIITTPAELSELEPPRHGDGPGIEAHIFVGSRAPWHRITDDLPQFDGHEEY